MNIGKIFPLLLVIVLACKSNGHEGQSYTAYTGATIIDGSGASPIKEGVLLLRAGHVVAVGTKENVDIPEHATVHDVTGKTIVPGFINAHGHVGDAKGIEGGHYSHQNIIDNLTLYARYGITTVVSLGGDKAEAESLRAVNDTTNTQHARLFIAGEIIHGDTPAEASAVVDSNRRMGVDIIKIRVDDNLGTSPKMPGEIYRAAIARAHALGFKVATHMYYLDDARKLLDAGTDMLAHSVRDQPVDEAFIALIKSKNACYCPTLTRELSTFVYGDTAKFFSDPFFTQTYDTSIIRPLLDPARQQQVKTSKNAITYQQQLPVAKANLKTLCDRGVPIEIGTDSEVPTRFIGYFEHLEMEMMTDAGLTPMQIIVSATKQAAQSLGLKNLGTLSKGNWADFVVVNANPLDDIRNMREIDQVVIGGEVLKP